MIEKRVRRPAREKLSRKGGGGGGGEGEGETKKLEITLRDLERLALDGVSRVRELFCNVRIQQPAPPWTT